MQEEDILFLNFVFHDQHNHPKTDNLLLVENLRIQINEEDHSIDRECHHKFLWVLLIPKELVD